MTVLQAIILGVVQGVAEFLPISSSGHLAVLHNVFGMDEPALTFDIVLHIGSLLAIVIVFWRDIMAIAKNPLGKMAKLLVVGTIPAVVAGFLLRDFIEILRTGIWLAVAFIVTGFLLMLADAHEQVKEKDDSGITYKDALIIGIFQAFALPPGISRSGATITGALKRGINRAAAARFSFMLALIAITGAGLLEAIKLIRGEVAVANIGFAPMAAGFIVSFVVGYFSIRLLLELIKKCKLRVFSYYVWGLAALILLDYLVIGKFF